MELYFRYMQHGNIFFYVVIFNALLLCTWVIIINQERIRSTAGHDQQRDDIFHKHSAKQQQPLVRLTAHFHQHKDVIFNKTSATQEKPRERSTGNYDQRRNDIFNNIYITFWLREVTVNDIKQWQEKFYASLARVRERPLKSLLNTASNLAYDFYNQNLLDNFIQLEIPLNEPKQSVNVANGNGLVQFLEVASCKHISPDVVLYNRIFTTGSETTGALLNFIAVVMDYFYTKRKCFYKILFS